MEREVHKVYKTHGAGNDFVILVGTGESATDTMAAAALELCDRHRSIGADGLVWVDTAAMPALACVQVWNPDGSVVGMCLNAARCVVVLLRRLFDIVQVEIRFASVAIQARATPDGARLQFVLHASESGDPAVSEISPGAWFVGLADPHVVVGCDSAGSLHDAPLADIAMAHAAGGGLCDRPPNCHLVSRADRHGHHYIRSFERRVEAETLACGSGCVASYLALSLDGEHTFHTKSGDPIRLERCGSHWSLEGPAVIAFETDLHVAALAGAIAGSPAALDAAASSDSR
ncbi:MAG: diaminopimelate epimerase [Rhodanobacteraceae bacterium]